MKLSVAIVAAAIVVGSVVHAAPIMAGTTDLLEGDNDMSARTSALEARTPMQGFDFGDLKDIITKTSAADLDAEREIDNLAAGQQELSRSGPSSPIHRLGAHGSDDDSEYLRASSSHSSPRHHLDQHELAGFEHLSASGRASPRQHLDVDDSASNSPKQPSSGHSTPRSHESESSDDAYWAGGWTHFFANVDEGQAASIRGEHDKAAKIFADNLEHGEMLLAFDTNLDKHRKAGDKLNEAQKQARAHHEAGSSSSGV